MSNKNNNDISMMNYILEEKYVLLEILDRRDEISKELIEKIWNRKIDEIIITGSGTSLHAGLATKAFLERVLELRVSIEYPMPFNDLGNIFNPSNTLFIGVSQTGQSSAVIDAIKKAKKLGALTLGISNNANSQLYEVSDIQVSMRCGAELCVAKTKGYIASIAILIIIGLEIAKRKQTITESEYLEYIDRLYATANNFDEIITTSDKWIESIQEELTKSKRIIVLGYGRNYGNVLEGSLKMLETMRYGICGYEMEEFCHGPYNSVDSETFIIYLASESKYKNKVVKLKSILNEITNHQFIITKNIDAYEPTQKDCLIPFIDDKDFHVFEYIIPLQMISAIISEKLGIDTMFASDPKFHSKIGSKFI